MNGGVFDEDVDVRSHLAALGPAALAELRRVLEAPDRTPILRALTARPAYADLATLIANADTDEVVRLRLLRAIRDLGEALRAPVEPLVSIGVDTFCLVNVY